jgi:hypothetical protein
MGTIEIKSIWGAVLWAGEATTVRDAVVKAVAARSNLRGSDLSDSDLRGVRDDFYKVLSAAPGAAGVDLAAIQATAQK